MMTVDEHAAHAPADLCFEVAADVERWPDILPHYRRVRFIRRDEFAIGLVEAVRSHRVADLVVGRDGARPVATHHRLRARVRDH